MMCISGNIKVFFDCIGKHQGDNSILDAIALLAMDFEIEHIDLVHDEKTYYVFPKIGIYFVFNKYSILESIFFYLTDSEHHKKYPCVSDLINGIHLYKKSIIELIGNPEFEGTRWIKYHLSDNKALHFEFNEFDELLLISIFLTSSL